MAPLVLGVDFDNTIVSYDALFHKVALEQGLVPSDVEPSKTAVKRFLCDAGQEPLWTRLQGEVYGPKMHESLPYPGVKAFFRVCRENAIPVCIISHKTRFPYLGEPFDLHQAAKNWLESHSFYDEEGAGLAEDQVFFELTREAKVARIASCRCTHYIDDLAEVLLHPDFPSNTERLLFSPGSVPPLTEGLAAVDHWTTIARLLLPDTFWQVVAREIAERPTGSLTPLKGGANNQVFSLNGDTVVKRYFQDSLDPRDRFAHEKAFYNHCRFAGVRSVPTPLGWAAPERVGVFSKVSGATPVQVTTRHVEAALGFIGQINEARMTGASPELPDASEACFSLATHLSTVSKRVGRMLEWELTDETEQEAQRFIRDEMAPALAHVKSTLELQYSPERLSEELPSSERCISPSDFGFHNSIEGPDGRLVFLDFEYAGWDDPAKLVCDFFCQPQIPVPWTYFEMFAVRLAADLALPKQEAFLGRCRSLLPLYRIKWISIILNEFAPAGRRRRRFSLGQVPVPEGLSAQLSKARSILQLCAVQ